MRERIGGSYTGETLLVWLVAGLVLGLVVLQPASNAMAAPAPSSALGLVVVSTLEALLSVGLRSSWADAGSPIAWQATGVGFGQRRRVTRRG